MGRACPFLLGYFLISPLRKLVQDPRKILGPNVKPGMRVLDVGSAMGYFSIPLAEMVGPQGKVYCVDIQEKMLAVLRKRAGKRGLLDRIETRLAQPDSLMIDDLAGQIDFALAFAVVHEVPDRARLLSQVSSALKPGGTLLIAEPKGHTSVADYQAAIGTARQFGLDMTGEPAIWGSRSGLLRRPG